MFQDKIKQVFAYIPLFFVIVVLMLGSLWFSYRMTSRSSGSDYRLKEQEIVSNWGSLNRQYAPNVASENKYDATSGKMVQAVENPNIRIAKSDLDINLSVDYRKKGLTYFTTYTTKFNGRFSIINESDKETDADFALPFSKDSSLISDVEIFTGDKDITGSQITKQFVGWKGKMKPKETKEVFVTYKSRGTEKFIYVVDNQRGLQDLSMKMTIDNTEGLNIPEGSVSPTILEKNDKSWTLAWEFKKMLTSPIISVELIRKMDLAAQIADLLRWAPFFLVLYIVSIIGLGFYERKKLAFFDLSILCALYSIFYPLLSYIVSVFENLSIFQAFCICMVVIGGITIYFYSHLFSRRFALIKGFLITLLFLGVFPVAALIPELTGLLGVIGLIVILAAAVQLRVYVSSHK